MSDYIAGLRADLVEAAARHQEAGTLRHRALPVLPRAWSRPALAAAAALAACVAAIVVAVSTVGPPTPSPTRPHRVISVPLGTESFDAVYAAGSLWVAGTNGEVVRVGRGRVRDRIKVAEQVRSISADGDAVWLTTIGKAISSVDGTIHADLVELDARSGAIRRKIPVIVADVGPVEAGAGAVWFVPDDSQSRHLLDRRDPATGRRVAIVNSDYNNDMAAGPELLWGVRRDGAVAEIDPRVNRIVAEVPEVFLNGPGQGPNGGPGQSSLAADGSGVWVAGGARGDVVFVQAGRIARRVRVGGGHVFAVARTRDALWAAVSTGAVSIRYRVIRIDPDTGRQTGTVALGHTQPTALAAAGRDLWLITLDGRATLIR